MYATQCGFGLLSLYPKISSLFSDNDTYVQRFSRLQLLVHLIVFKQGCPHGVGSWFVYCYFLYCCIPSLQHVLKGIKSAQAKMGHQPRPRLPITPVILGKLRLVWEKTRHDYNSIMLWAACTTCFFGFLRTGEITAPTTRTFDPTYHLTLEDIPVDNPCQPGAVWACIKVS